MLDAKAFLTNRKFVLFLFIVILSFSTIAFSALSILKLKTLNYGEDSPPAEVEATYGLVKLAMRLNRAVYKLRETVNITLNLTNIGNKTVYVGSYPPGLDFIVYNQALQQIYANIVTYVLCMVGPCSHVEPGESLDITFTWTQLGKFGSGPQDIYRQVDPGSYFIAGRTSPGGVFYDMEETKLIEVETPKVLIEVLPEESTVVQKAKFPLKLTMALGKTTFEVGELVNMTLIIENICNETLPLTLCECNFGFVVYDEFGSVVYDYNKNHCHIALYVPMPLPPGLFRSGTLSWYQEYNPVYRGWGQDPLFEYRKVPSGRYQIVGEFISVLDRVPLRTPPVTITIGL